MATFDGTLPKDRMCRAPNGMRELEKHRGGRARPGRAVLVGRMEADLYRRSEALVRGFAIGLNLRSAVGLLDLVGCSRCGPMDQLPWPTTLEQALWRAEANLARAALQVTALRTATGDGFSVWDPETGDDGAHLLPALVLQTFTQFDRIGRQQGFGGGLLEAALGVAATFTFHRLSGRLPQDDTFIVGDVTVEIARLIEACEPGRILVGTGLRHHRLQSWAGAVATLNATWRSAADRIGHAIQAHLQGDRNARGEWRLRPVVVNAKHGHR